MTFGERLRMLRREAGLSQEELGKRAHVSARVIGYYEADDRFPRDPQTLIDLAKAFQVSLDYLLDNPVRQESVCPSRFCYMKTMTSEQRLAVNQYISYLRWVQRQEEEEESRREAEKIAAVTQSFESVLNPIPGEGKVKHKES